MRVIARLHALIRKAITFVRLTNDRTRSECPLSPRADIDSVTVRIDLLEFTSVRNASQRTSQFLCRNGATKKT